MFTFKKVKKHILLFCCLNLLVCPQILGLSLDNFLHTISSQHPLFKEQSYSEAIQKRKKRASTGSQDISFTSNAYYAAQEPYQVSPFTATNIKSTGLSTGISKTFWNTGGFLSLGTNTIKVTRTLPSSSFNLGPGTYYQNEVSVSYSQPLLSNFGGIQSQFNTKLETITLKRVTLTVKETKEQFLSELTSLYFDWIFMIEKEKILQNRLSLAIKNVIETSNKYKSQLVDKVDVLRAKTSLKSLEKAQLMALTEKTALEKKIRIMSPQEAFLGSSPNYDIYQLPSVEKFNNNSTHTLFQPKLISITKETLEEQLLFYQDSAKDSLNLTLKTALLGANSTFSDATSLDRSDQTISLDYTKILGDTTTKETIAKIQLELSQLKETDNKVKLELQQTLESLYLQIENLKALVKLSASQVKLANAQTKEERKSYKQGRSQLNFVIQAQDRELDAKLQLLSTAITLQKTIYQYHALTDNLYHRFETHSL